MIDIIQTHLARSDARDEPKYQALRNAILDAISKGELAPGSQLPTEAELSRLLPYSLGTVQKAYGELARGGLITRSRGRGSFVAAAEGRMADPWHCRFLDEGGAILPVYPRLLGHQVAEAEERWEKLFGVERQIVRIDRTLSINGEFEVVSRFFATERIACAILSLGRESIETANFKAVLWRELGLPIARILQTIAAARSTERPGSRGPGQHLLLEATAYTAGEEVAYFQELLIPPTRRKLLFDSALSV